MTILEEATALIPGYVDADLDTERVSKVRSDLIAADWGSEVRNANIEYQQTLATSSDINEIRAAFEKLDTARITERAFTTIQADLNALGTAQRAASRSFSAEAVEPALSFLHDRLTRLMSRVSTLHNTLGKVRTIEAALEGSETIRDAWRAIESAASEYEEIRNVQNRVTISIINNGADRSTALRRLGRLRNAFEDESIWTQARRPSGRRPSRTTYNRDLLDWLEDPPAAEWFRAESDIWPTGDRIEYLRWLATKSAPWVPTIAQLDTASAQINLLTRRFEFVAEIRPALDAYDAYFTGVTPRRPLDTNAIREQLPPERRSDYRDSEGRTIADPRIVAAYE